MTVTTATPRARTGAWLLIASLAAFVLVPVVNISVFSAHGIGLFADITPSQMAALGAQWAIAVLTVLLATLIGNVGIILTATVVGARPWRWVSAAVAGVAIVVAASDAVVRLGLSGFTEARLGDAPGFGVAEALSNAAFAISALAIVLFAVALIAEGYHRVAGLVVGIIAAVVFLVSLVAYAFVPPFLLGLLWLPLGIVVLRGLKRRTLAD